jgi:hypothetical protein
MIYWSFSCLFPCWESFTQYRDVTIVSKGLQKAQDDFNLPIDCQLDLIDGVCNPSLLYSWDIWGYENVDIIFKLKMESCQLLSTTVQDAIIYHLLVIYVNPNWGLK